MHPSGRVYVSRNVKFNANEFPFLTLFSFPSSAPKTISSSLGYSTDFLQPIFTSLTSSTCPQVAQSPQVPNQIDIISSQATTPSTSSTL